ncbi:hypothetical protein CPB84DRAFT_150844 [Gymnopilus junonius]|uniref:F-box domain-containing protein n=1 Tax=Gymnopilus junonius TaxID=109634 RepID=A0A9P5TJS3_GYMJU|nr:hypothetical protein CPB84DRAFT_150844 [Gymnopilus junonius]
MVTSESEDRRTSVAQTLPFDILGEIFLHIAALQFHDPGPISVVGKAKPLYDESLHLLNATEPPLLLCHVCQTWKNAALNISQLWDGVYLPITYFQSSNLLRKGPGSEENPEISHTMDVLDAQSIQFVEWWENNVNIGLSESPTSSLLRRPSFCFRRKEAEISDLSSAYPGPSLAQFFVTPFFRSARRIELDVLDQRVIRALYYNPSDSKSDQGLLSSSPLHFENLLELRVQKFIYRSDYGQPGCTFPPSPSLLKLHVSLLHYNAFLGDDISSPFFPFAQLTHISLSNPIVHAAWKLLLITCTHLTSRIKY